MSVQMSASSSASSSDEHLASLLQPQQAQMTFSPVSDAPQLDALRAKAKLAKKKRKREPDNSSPAVLSPAAPASRSRAPTESMDREDGELEEGEIGDTPPALAASATSISASGGQPLTAPLLASAQLLSIPTGPKSPFPSGLSRRSSSFSDASESVPSGETYCSEDAARA